MDPSPPTTARTMRHEVVAGTLLCIHGPLPVDDAEWTAYCAESVKLSHMGVLVVADRSSPGPNSRQRAELAESLAKRASHPKVAVVTASAAHRGIVTVMTWLQKGTVKAYSPARLSEALSYASVAPSARAQVLRRVHELGVDLDSRWIAQTIPIDPAIETRP